MEEHYNTFEYKVVEILTDFENKKIHKFKANVLIQEQLKYCAERDERIRKRNLDIWIDSQNEINKID